MADMTPLNDILNGTAADATDVQANFQTIETYINSTNLIRADGTEVMTANLDVDSNKIVNLAVPTAATDAARFGDHAVGDYKTNASPIVITTSPTTVVTLTVQSAAAGMAVLYLFWDITTAGVSSYDQGFPTGLDVDLSLTGSTWIAPTVGPGLVTFTTNGTQSTSNRSSPYLISLSAGTNTIVVQLTRVNNGTTATDGTVTANTGFRAMIMGA